MAQGLLQQQIIIAAAQLFIAPHNNSEPAAALASYFESDREHARILLYLYYTHAILWRFMADELLPAPKAKPAQRTRHQPRSTLLPLSRWPEPHACVVTGRPSGGASAQPRL